MIHLLLSPEQFAGAAATVEGEAHHHLFRVRRAVAGERLRVVDGRGAARWATIATIDRRTARLALGDAAPPNEPGLAVTVVVATPKPERAAWLVEKTTELGVVAVRFAVAEREARRPLAAQLERWRRIAVSAVEQCGRSVVPEIVAAGTLDEELERGAADGAAIAVLDGEGRHVAPVPGADGRVALFVGPEGGWSPAERTSFVRRGAGLWRLGGTVLRVETAAVVAAGLVLAAEA
ncbi:MAG: 16S rRNA (uracil(1498)-N(3))-methyltransferase [Thermoanaerobaculia bacterium]